MAFPQRTYTEVPQDEAISPQLREFLNSLLSQVNALSGKGSPTPGQGIAALSQNTIDPKTGQITSSGNRMASIITDITFVAASTNVQFFWDGINPISAPSVLFTILRDDGSIYRNPAGSGLLCTGLSPSTTYFFYAYFNEAQQVIQFASVPGVSVGSPSIAFTSPNQKGAQTQILRGNLLLAINLASNGITTPASGTNAAASGGSGGGSVGGGFNRGRLL